MMEISLRPATQDDYDFLWELHRATMRPYVEETWGWEKTWQEEYFREHFDPARREVIEGDGVAVGCLSVQRRQDRLFLSVIEIAPEYQNRGIGTKLIQDLLDEAAGRTVPVELQVLKANPAHRLYERLGFVVVEETETHRVMRTVVR